MIIKSLSLKNFQCYFGEHDKNTFKFRDGLNLIIGDNGGGKSKLFDAFYWVINDQIFNSDTRRFLPTKQVGETLVSDRAKKECEIDREITTEVALIAQASSGGEYRFRRIMKARKIGDNEWLKTGGSRLLIDEWKSVRWSSIEAVKHKSILSLVIPAHLRPYMWFQGEQVETLMDFNDKSTLNSVVNLLSNITVYDELINITKKGHESATRTLHSAQNKLSKSRGKSRDLNLQLKKVKDKIDVKEAALEESKDNLEIAKNKIAEVVGKIADAEKRIELKRKKQSLELEIERNDDRLTEKYNGLHKNMFEDFWVLKHSQGYFDQYSKRYNKFLESHNAKISEANAPVLKLPINIPQPLQVNQMLEEEKCFVCDRDAHKGTVEYEYIRSLLSRSEPSIQEDVFANDCSRLFRDLYENGLSFGQLISSTDKRVAAKFKEISDLKNEITSSKSEIDTIKSEFHQLIEDDGSEAIVSSFRMQEANRDKYQSLVNADEKIVENAKKEVQGLEEQLKKLVVGVVDEFVERSNEIFGDLHRIAESTRDDVFHNLIVELEEQANALFDRMTEQNHAIKGKIKLKRLASGKYLPEIVGTDGYVLSNPNDSILVLAKLALIMAILISRAKWSENYSLILDAPTSKMAKNYTHGFYKTIGECFTQSIVATYDFVDEDQRESLSEFNLGSVYKIEPHFPNGDSDDRSDLEIIINEVQI